MTTELNNVALSDLSDDDVLALQRDNAALRSQLDEVNKRPNTHQVIDVHFVSEKRRWWRTRSWQCGECAALTADTYSHALWHAGKPLFPGRIPLTGELHAHECIDVDRPENPSRRGA